jgi:hypothetical protein
MSKLEKELLLSHCQMIADDHLFDSQWDIIYNDHNLHTQESYFNNLSWKQPVLIVFAGIGFILFQ